LSNVPKLDTQFKNPFLGSAVFRKEKRLQNDNMTEVEVKILEINRNKLEAKLIEIGAKKTFEGDLSAYHFDFLDGSLSKEKNVLRLRKEGEKVTFTFKKPVQSDEAKIREESEVEVSDFGVMLGILEGLGLYPDKKTDKKRIIYSLPDVHFALDKLTGEHDFVPMYLEIETEEVETLYKYVQKLGFSKEDCKTWTQEEVIEYYETKRV
jgi:adenylate cyclase class 2